MLKIGVTSAKDTLKSRLYFYKLYFVGLTNSIEINEAL